MNFKITKIAAAGVQSLCWFGDELIDWVNCGARYTLDGSVEKGHVSHAYRFDAATMSPSGRYSAIYERLGTKALILDQGRLLREINRSYYCAAAYDYPIHLFALSDGREVIAHCPEEYHQIEIDDLETGARLTQRNHQDPIDFFHSRLTTNDTGSILMSAGWVWHPFDSMVTFDLASILQTPELLDQGVMTPPDSSTIESSNACFISSSQIAVTCAMNAVSFADAEDQPARYPGSIAVYDLAENQYRSAAPLEAEAGDLMPLDLEHVIGFYQHPKVIHLASGRIVHSWPDLFTGTQTSSISRDTKFGPFAPDISNKRFAVADETNITVVELQ